MKISYDFFFSNKIFEKIILKKKFQFFKNIYFGPTLDFFASKWFIWQIPQTTCFFFVNSLAMIFKLNQKPTTNSNRITNHDSPFLWNYNILRSFAFFLASLPQNWMNNLQTAFFCLKFGAVLLNSIWLASFVFVISEKPLPKTMFCRYCSP